MLNCRTSILPHTLCRNQKTFGQQLTCQQADIAGLFGFVGITPIAVRKKVIF
jgi:hypothetical protein